MQKTATVFRVFCIKNLSNNLSSNWICALIRWETMNGAIFSTFYTISNKRCLSFSCEWQTVRGKHLLLWSIRIKLLFEYQFIIRLFCSMSNNYRLDSCFVLFDSKSNRLNDVDRSQSNKSRWRNIWHSSRWSAVIFWNMNDVCSFLVPLAKLLIVPFIFFFVLYTSVVNDLAHHYLHNQTAECQPFESDRSLIFSCFFALTIDRIRHNRLEGVVKLFEHQKNE